MTDTNPLSLLLVSTDGYVADNGEKLPAGTVLNRIAWDGVSEYEPHPFTEFRPDRGEACWKPTDAAPSIITASEFMARFTKPELLAVFAERQTNPLIDLFITQILANGTVDLANAEVAADMRAVTDLGLLKSARATTILQT